MRSRLLLVAVIWLSLSGCSTAGDRAQGAASDRIVVATADGQVYTIGPDGGDRVDLAPGDASGQGLQPVWSPDGTRIAWSERSGTSFSIVSTNPDGTERAQADTLFSGYFGYWDPTSTHLGFLGNAPPGTGLVIDDGSGTALDSVVDSDTFYYFSWSPTGTQWIVHSGSGLRIVNLDGTSTELDLDDAVFRAPVWAPDGTVLLALQIDGENVIARYDPVSLDAESLVMAGDVTNFVLDPTGRFLAIESIEVVTGESLPGEGVQVSLRQAQEVARVVVYDLQTGATRQVVDERTGGFWWSPDGTKLALLVSEAGSTTRGAQWLVWSTKESFRTEAFLPSRLFVGNYVPFFDQFAQSVTPWSPDSSRFTFTGTTNDGRSGVFVQPAQSDTPAELIAADDGIALWSPT